MHVTKALTGLGIDKATAERAAGLASAPGADATSLTSAVMDEHTTNNPEPTVKEMLDDLPGIN